MRQAAIGARVLILVAIIPQALAGYTNFESSHVHPIDLTPSGTRLLAVNTPDALLEVFAVQPDGSLLLEAAIPVGLEPVSVVARSDSEAWVVNQLSDTVSIVDLGQQVVTKTLHVGDEPSDVVFTAARAFVAASQEDTVYVFSLSNLDAAPTKVTLDGRDVRALAVSANGQQVYAVVLRSGNGTTVVNAQVIFGNLSGVFQFDPDRLAAFDLRDMTCPSPGPPAYPPLPPDIDRNPALTDPPANQHPKVGLIVGWDEGTSTWKDEAGQDWTHCLPYMPADNDLFVIDATTLAVAEVDGLGTSLFDVSVHPSGKIYVPNTEARNLVRFEHPLGVQGHPVDNRLTVVDPGNGNALTFIDLNTHVDRESDPTANLTERQASISQPGMLVWNASGSQGFLTGIGTRKLFRVDGSCTTGACIFGASRAAPDAVEVGQGPTGVALLEKAQPEDDRLYVLNRISHSISIVRADTLALLDEIDLHDPSSPETRDGRRFLYDAIDGSGHGDAACSSCHLSGDMDGLAWDLGNPAGNLAPYSDPLDNVRFIENGSGSPETCTQFCTTHQGFDPQKGPMATQTLRGMLEPLHWRGDRSTMRAFNGAFVDLMGTADLNPDENVAEGLTPADMDKFRDFALEMTFPPNPYRNVDDTLPNAAVLVPGALTAGNPFNGSNLFDNHQSDAGKACKSCHAHPFGAAGGVLGGVEPTNPVSEDTAGIFFGVADGSNHNDLKVPHLRNMYEKAGPVWASPGGQPPETSTLFGFTHDGAIPDLLRFLSLDVFTLNASQVADIASFMFHFPTGTKPAVGQHLTVPAGTPPTGSASDEALLTGLLSLGDLADSNRHCELVATRTVAGTTRRSYLSGGVWVADKVGDPALGLTPLREAAGSEISFLCAPIGSGLRLGGDRDEDAFLDGDDCAPGDASAWVEVAAVSNVTVDRDPATQLGWDDQAPAVGSSVRYEVLGGSLSLLGSSGLAATGCLASDLEQPGYEDPGPDPLPGEGVFYLIRAVNPCGVGSSGPGRESLDALGC